MAERSFWQKRISVPVFPAAKSDIVHVAADNLQKNKERKEMLEKETE